MNTNELRIGNFLLTDYDYLCEVELIHRKHFDCRELTTGVFVVNGKYKPILINDDWFFKLGFYKEGDYFIYPNREILEILFKGVGYDILCPDCVFYNIQYVHELQNIYSSIGIELKIHTI